MRAGSDNAGYNTIWQWALSYEQHSSALLRTDAPVVGVAITTESSVPGCATGATHEVDVAEVVQFCVEAAKEFTAGKCSFYDKDEFEMIQKLYGSMKVLQTRGNQ